MRNSMEGGPKSFELGGGVITLPADQALVERLRDKLEEYKDRLVLTEKILADDYKAPEQKTRAKNSHMDSYYKIAVLEALLKDGTVDIGTLREEKMREKDPDQFAFDNAVGVIEKYTKPGGSEEVHGGTGL